MVVEPVWLGRQFAHRVICGVGHEASPRPDHVFAGKGICRACAGKDPGQAWKQFRERVAAAGGQVIEPAWLGNNTPHRIACSAGHAIAVWPSTTRRQRSICRVCSGHDAEAASETFYGIAAEQGWRVVEPRWLGTKAKHRIVCAEGHETRAVPNSVQQGHVVCPTCAGKDQAAQMEAFRIRVAEQGGQVVEARWMGSQARHRVVCAVGHEVSPTPTYVQQGGGICRLCRGRFWDVFYVVTSAKLCRVKFGITSQDPRRRVATHRLAGYETVVRTIVQLSDASVLEQAVLGTLKLAGAIPAQGREYHDIAALPMILDVVDHWVDDHPTDASAVELAAAVEEAHTLLGSQYVLF